MRRRLPWFPCVLVASAACVIFLAARAQGGTPEIGINDTGAVKRSAAAGADDATAAATARGTAVEHPVAALGGSTRIEADSTGKLVRILIDGREVVRIDAAGLHVDGAIERSKGESNSDNAKPRPRGEGAP